jgi:hypothetical protein
MTDEFDRGRKQGIEDAKRFLEQKRRSRVDQVFEREVRRFGLAIDFVDYGRYAVRAVLTIPGSNVFCRLTIDEEAMMARAPHMRDLIGYEVRAIRDLLLLRWHFDAVRGKEDGLPLIIRGEPCKEHADNVVTQVGHTDKTYRCDGGQKLAVHALPERCVIVRGGGIEVIEP